MSWQKASKRDQIILLEFVKGRETRCVPFSARIRNSERRCTIFINQRSGLQIQEALMVTSYGLALPVLENGTRSSDEQESLAPLLRQLPIDIRTLMGMREDVARIQRLRGLVPRADIDYFLMGLRRDQFGGARHPPPGIQIRRATLKDLHWLFPLQKAYEFEEVLLNKEDFNENTSYALFRRSLRNNVVLVAERSGVPISKAGTNERGFGTDQIGGVFTLPEERGKGIARTVVERLLAYIFQEKVAASLFVKKQNRAALALYDGLGLSVHGDYSIHYF